MSKEKRSKRQHCLENNEPGISPSSSSHYDDSTAALAATVAVPLRLVMEFNKSGQVSSRSDQQSNVS
jgi:hypothetical protein